MPLLAIYIRRGLVLLMRRNRDPGAITSCGALNPEKYN